MSGKGSVWRRGASLLENANPHSNGFPQPPQNSVDPLANASHVVANTVCRVMTDGVRTELSLFRQCEISEGNANGAECLRKRSAIAGVEETTIS